VKRHIKKPIKTIRVKGLPLGVRQILKVARRRHGWSQAVLGQRAGLPQMHISAIETGKIAPRFDTLLDLVRVLDYDLMLVPRTLVPAVQALLHDQEHGDAADRRPLYAVDEDDEASEP
jgi:transcriptional regulator with XRE-family HTH domain